MISQDLFDETVLENQDVFEYTEEEAVKETINEFLQQQESSSQASQHSQNRLEHLLLTHPSSPEGKRDREIHARFEECLDGDNHDLAVATSILKEVQQEPPSSLTPKEDNATAEDGTQSKTTNRTRLLSLWFLMLQKKLWSKVTEQYSTGNGEDRIISLIDFVVALFPDTSVSLHPLARDLKRAIAPFWLDKNEETNVDTHTVSTSHWFRTLESFFEAESGDGVTVPFALARLARNLCNGCEDNKKAFVQASLLSCYKETSKSGLQLLMDCLGSYTKGCSESSPFELVREICRLLAVLSKFQPLAEPNDSPSTPDAPSTGGTPLVSSAHANVKEFQRAGAVPRLHRIARESLQALQEPCENTETTIAIQQHQDLLCESLAALRTMAIDNDIVQNMIALGILDTVRDVLEIVVTVATAQEETGIPSTLGLATATLGLVRNLCANDEVKTTICKSSLPSILQVMQHYLDDDKTGDSPGSTSRRTKGHAILGEHACGILAAMALRQPQNAHAIVEEGGHVLIFQAMRAFPNKVTLQRQACLAVRNIASRLTRMSYDQDVAKLLDAGAEDVLQKIAGKHPASAEEAYAALRDLGCNPQMFQTDAYGNVTRSVTEAFGTIKSNFRPVYE